MKQHTNSEQTAKLIELGFEKPKGWEYPAMSNRYVMAVHIDRDPEFNYSIGELIEMLPEAVCLSYDDSVHYYLEIYSNTLYWNVAYMEGPYEAYSVESDELIDALYDMCIKLKEEGVI